MGVMLLGKIKIHEIAKKLDLTSKEVLEKAKNIYVEEEKYIAYKIGLIDGLKIKNECS